MLIMPSKKGKHCSSFHNGDKEGISIDGGGTSFNNNNIIIIFIVDVEEKSDGEDEEERNRRRQTRERGMICTDAMAKEAMYGGISSSRRRESSMMALMGCRPKKYTPTTFW